VKKKKVCCMLFAPLAAFRIRATNSSSIGGRIDPPRCDIGSTRGAAPSFNYCGNCHSAEIRLRYNRLTDLGLTETADQGKTCCFFSATAKGWGESDDDQRQSARTQKAMRSAHRSGPTCRSWAPPPGSARQRMALQPIAQVYYRRTIRARPAGKNLRVPQRRHAARVWQLARDPGPWKNEKARKHEGRKVEHRKKLVLETPWQLSPISEYGQSSPGTLVDFLS